MKDLRILRLLQESVGDLWVEQVCHGGERRIWIFGWSGLKSRLRLGWIFQVPIGLAHIRGRGQGRLTRKIRVASESGIASGLDAVFFFRAGVTGAAEHDGEDEKERKAFMTAV